jgi:hypothetical protein
MYVAVGDFDCGRHVGPRGVTLDSLNKTLNWQFELKNVSSRSVVLDSKHLVRYFTGWISSA